MAKPVVKQSVKTAAAVTVNITVRKAIEPVVSTLKSVQAKTENKRQVYQEKVNNYALKGTVEKAIAGFDQGLIDRIDSAVNGVYQLYNHPLETISDVFGSTLENFSYESRINRNKAFGQNYADANKSGYTGISAVTYNMGREFPEFALTVAAGMKGSPQAGKGTKPPTGGNSIRNAFNSPFNGSPQLAGANGIVISGAVPAEVSVSSSVSAGVLGVRAGVAGSVAVSNIYYSGKGSGQSSGEINQPANNKSRNNGDTSEYLPMDANGNPIPLRKQRVNGQDIPLPDPSAQGRAHTVIGSKISSKTGEIYKQTATFPEGTWPTANGQDVPWSEVHWTNHGRSDHPNPHQHIFEYNPDKGGWIRGGPTYYRGK